MFLILAIATKADALVSGDAQLLEIEYAGGDIPASDFADWLATFQAGR